MSTKKTVCTDEAANDSLVRISPLLVLDKEEKEIICNGMRVHLKPQQFYALSYLAERKSGYCTLEELFKQTHKTKEERQKVADPDDAMRKLVDCIRHVVRTAPGCGDLLVIKNNRGYGEYRVCRKDERDISRARQKRQPKRSLARSRR